MAFQVTLDLLDDGGAMPRPTRGGYDRVRLPQRLRTRERRPSRRRVSRSGAPELRQCPIRLVLQRFAEGTLAVRPRGLSHGLQKIREPAARFGVVGVKLHGALEIIGRRGPVALAQGEEPRLVVGFRAAGLELQADVQAREGGRQLPGCPRRGMDGRDQEHV
jgi:hypothetical protein